MLGTGWCADESMLWDERATQFKRSKDYSVRLHVVTETSDATSKDFRQYQGSKQLIPRRRKLQLETHEHKVHKIFESITAIRTSILTTCKQKTHVPRTFPDREAEARDYPACTLA